MGSAKDQLLDIESERFDEWLAENYPDVVPGSEEWEQASNLYYWEQETIADQAQWDHVNAKIYGRFSPFLMSAI